MTFSIKTIPRQLPRVMLMTIVTLLIKTYQYQIVPLVINLVPMIHLVHMFLDIILVVNLVQVFLVMNLYRKKITIILVTHVKKKVTLMEVQTLLK